MRSISKWKKTILLSCMAGTLTFAVAVNQNMDTAWAAPSGGVCITNNVVVRESAVSGAQVGGISEGQEVSIQNEVEGEDGKTWYEITYELNGSERTGWVRGDLIDTTVSASTQTTGADRTGSTEEDDEEKSDDTQEQGLDGIQLETGKGYVTLMDVPEEEASKLSDRFVESVCEFEEGSVAAYQLSIADELVAEDASLVDFYYVYGTNELGVSGWYIYDANEGTIQRNLSNMQYEIPTETKEEAADGSGFEMDSVAKMLIGVLAVVCLLLLVLTIIFSVRYRRLRRLLEDGTELDEDDEDDAVTEFDRSAESEEREEEIQSDLQDDFGLDIFELFDKEFHDKSDENSETEQRELEDLERILSREFSSQKAEAPFDDNVVNDKTVDKEAINEEPEYYDDDDDDLEFL